MSSYRVRRQQLVRQAEGYLELGMAQHALDVLSRFGDGEALPGTVYFLRGEALRWLKRYDEAVACLNLAAEMSPGRSSEIGLALGWCYKRSGRIDLAIQSLRQAISDEPNQALLHYNLACYLSLAGDKHQAIFFLSRTFTLDQHLRNLVADESDFDNIRSDPDFQALTAVIV